MVRVLGLTAVLAAGCLGTPYASLQSPTSLASITVRVFTQAMDGVLQHSYVVQVQLCNTLIPTFHITSLPCRLQEKVNTMLGQETEGLSLCFHLK